MTQLRSVSAQAGLLPWARPSLPPSLPRPTLVLPPVGSPSGHCPGCSLLAARRCPGLRVFAPFWAVLRQRLPVSPPPASGASRWEPPLGEFPAPGRRGGGGGGSPPWEPGQPRVPRPLGPQPPRVSRVLSLHMGVRLPVPCWAGRPTRGRFFGSGRLARRQRGRERAQSRAPRVGCEQRHRRAAGRLGGRSGPDSWLRPARGGRGAPSPPGRRCWSGRAGWTGAASAPAGATSTGSCAA